MRANWLQDNDIAVSVPRFPGPEIASSGPEAVCPALKSVNSNAKLTNSTTELGNSTPRLTNSSSQHGTHPSGNACPAPRHACSALEQPCPELGEACHELESANYGLEEASSALGSGTPRPEAVTSASPHTWPRPPPDGSAWSKQSISLRHGDGGATNTPDRKAQGSTMKFPKREPEIARLAQDLITGLRTHTEAFPNPPVSADQLEEALAQYNRSRDAAIVLHAQATQGTTAKDEDLVAVVDLMKTTIRHAENLATGDDGKLQLLGWGGRRGRTPNDSPGQVGNLRVLREGKDWILLDWDEPANGGTISAYQLQRRRRDGDGAWTNVGMAVESEILLTGQESGVEFEYQVTARNKAGEGPPSNIVRAVL